MKYCVRCITPDSRPNIVLDDEGVCSACRNFGTKPDIDWDNREQALQEVFERARIESQGYDCLIPVSGGKDSTWQVVKCLEYGLRILAYTWRPPGRTEIGQRNLENLARLGVDHIDLTVSPDVEKRFTLASFRKFGSNAIPMHLGIYNTPLRLALQMKIPLIIYGENSAFEYGNAADARTGFTIDANWLKKYGVTHGTTAEDWVGSAGLTRKDLAPYLAPDIPQLESAGIRAIFLGYYLPWDVEVTREIATRHGFKSVAGGARTGYYDYADLDDDFISIHHWMKWFKFGFTRSFDNLSLEIRNGRITRDAAIAWLQERGDETPREDIEKFCCWLGTDRGEFNKISETFRNQDVWKNEGGRWQIPGFLIRDHPWQ
jgi:N-acetyl sugar amidotransferase